MLPKPWPPDRALRKVRGALRDPQSQRNRSRYCFSRRRLNEIELKTVSQ